MADLQLSPAMIEQMAEELYVDHGVTMSPLPQMGNGDPWAMEEEAKIEPEGEAGTATPLVAEARELLEPLSCTRLAFEARDSRRQQRKEY